jgi:hypothetical protein
MKPKLLNAILTSTVCVLFSPLVTATMITPVHVQSSSTLATYNVNNLINESGLTGMVHDTDFNNMWLSNGGRATTSLIFDMGKMIDLAGAYVWQYDASCCVAGRGVASFNILASSDGVSFSAVTPATMALQGNGSDPITAEFIPFHKAARYVKFDIASSFGSAYAGLSEVKFEQGMQMAAAQGGAAIPEPRVIGLLALSLLSMYAVRGHKRLAVIR